MSLSGSIQPEGVTGGKGDRIRGLIHAGNGHQTNGPGGAVIDGSVAGGLGQAAGGVVVLQHDQVAGLEAGVSVVDDDAGRIERDGYGGAGPAPCSGDGTLRVRVRVRGRAPGGTGRALDGIFVEPIAVGVHEGVIRVQDRDHVRSYTGSGRCGSRLISRSDGRKHRP